MGFGRSVKVWITLQMKKKWMTCWHIPKPTFGIWLINCFLNKYIDFGNQNTLIHFSLPRPKPELFCHSPIFFFLSKFCEEKVWSFCGKHSLRASTLQGSLKGDRETYLRAWKDQTKLGASTFDLGRIWDNLEEEFLFINTSSTERCKYVSTIFLRYIHSYFMLIWSWDT